MCTVVRGVSCRKRAECGKENWLRMSSAIVVIVVYKCLTIHYVIARYYKSKIRNSVCCSFVYHQKMSEGKCAHSSVSEE